MRHHSKGRHRGCEVETTTQNNKIAPIECVQGGEGRTATIQRNWGHEARAAKEGVVAHTLGTNGSCATCKDSASKTNQRDPKQTECEMHDLQIL